MFRCFTKLELCKACLNHNLHSCARRKFRSCSVSQGVHVATSHKLLGPMVVIWETVWALSICYTLNPQTPLDPKYILCSRMAPLEKLRSPRSRRLCLHPLHRCNTIQAPKTVCPQQFKDLGFRVPEWSKAWNKRDRAKRLGPKVKHLRAQDLGFRAPACSLRSLVSRFEFSIQGLGFRALDSGFVVLEV